MQENLDKAAISEGPETRRHFRFPLHLLDELEGALASKNPVRFREGMTELPVIIETLRVEQRGLPDEKIEFTGNSGGEKVRGIAIEKIGALYIEFERAS